MDPIVAISSPPGSSLRAILRVSGSDLAPLRDALFTDPLIDRQLTATRWTLDGVDMPVWVLWMPGPRTFTGLDTIELQLPGGRPLLTMAMDHVLAMSQQVLGAGRLAEAGEFSRRAFESGRIDLTQAEGIAATIAAVGDAQLQAAARLRGGHLGRWAQELVAVLGDLLALVEAGIDFTDQEDVVSIAPVELASALERCRGQIARRLAESGRWHQVDALPRVVLAGPANAGKSTLFNALLGRQRVVVSSIAGTTRDPVTEPLTLTMADGSKELLLVDTAGLLDGGGSLNEAAVAAARQLIRSADLLVWIQPADATAIDPPFDGAVLRVWSKIDQHPLRPNVEGVGIAAIRGEGLEVLREQIVEALAERLVHLDAEQWVLQDRHRVALAAAETELAEAETRFDSASRSLAAPELVADAMRSALDRLGEVGGQMTADDVLGRVFATFCVGK